MASCPLLAVASGDRVGKHCLLQDLKTLPEHHSLLNPRQQKCPNLYTTARALGAKCALHVICDDTSVLLKFQTS